MSENTVLRREDIEGKYLTSVDVLRVICITALINRVPLVLKFLCFDVKSSYIH